MEYLVVVKHPDRPVNYLWKRRETIAFTFDRETATPFENQVEALLATVDLKESLHLDEEIWTEPKILETQLV